MFDRFDQSELLAYIEGELTPKQAAKLEARLAKSPEAAEVVQRMREDRDLLRSAPEPNLPRDFLPELEPRLARPMLTGQRPGEYRRRHRRKNRRAVLMRFLTAAVILIALSAGVWWTVAFMSGPGGPIVGPPAPGVEEDGDRFASGESSPTPKAQKAAPAPALVVANDAWPPPGSVIHHLGPMPPGKDTLMLAAAIEGPPISAMIDPGTAETAPQILPVSFAIVLQADDVLSAEELLIALLDDLTTESLGPVEPPVALVRNFSDAEAEALVALLAPAPARRDARPPDYRTADVDGQGDWPPVEFDGDPRLRRNRALAHTLRAIRQRRQDEAEARAAFSSRQIMGPAELAPSYERQLDLSGRGATHTVTIEAGRLDILLEGLYADAELQATLQPLPDPDRKFPEARAEQSDAEDIPVLSRWVRDLRTIRRQLAQLHLGDDEGAQFIELPIVIHTAE